MLSLSVCPFALDFDSKMSSSEEDQFVRVPLRFSGAEADSHTLLFFDSQQFNDDESGSDGFEEAPAPKKVSLRGRRSRSAANSDC